ncbi:unnamed protein product [Rotaria sp. Silwood1]|nr:unnamed protein product [Rotaria sp. Silwood1]
MQTKLIKIICKRAALMRAPYAQSSWTTNTSTIKKKSSSPSKTAISIPNKSILENDSNIKLVNKKKHIDDKDPKHDAEAERNEKNKLK